ncbi:unnamed protein product [Prorocentrum cordatum]|uniref:Uncharacterized protein n=1 Tax=Prorocentrum cordatum TaxID=2364126 RepID=A0ABN9PH02_9DINO|nr:unnamed protein product [Polarella glacialis]
MKTVQEFESELAKATARKSGGGDGGKGEARRPRGGDALSKQPVHGKGSHCEVHKHSGMGCAVVSMESAAARESVMVYCEGKAAGSDQVKTQIGGVSVQVRRHLDKNTKQDVVTDIFCAWGHRAEKETPLEVDEIAEAFDKLLTDAHTHGNAQAAATLSTSPQHLAGVRAPPPPPMHHPTLAGAAGAAAMTPAQLQQAEIEDPDILASP